jgi:antitoxin VapB
MGTQLNIKSEDAYRLASELSELTGESLTSAVTTALRERLDRERAVSRKAAKSDRLMAIAAEMRARMPKPLPKLGDDWMYDENGLPV